MPGIFVIDFLFLLPHAGVISFQLALGYFVSLLTVTVIHWLCFSVSDVAEHRFLCRLLGIYQIVCVYLLVK